MYSRTVDTHISSLRKKLGDKGKIIKSVPKIGYRADT
ncbi:MAG: helix-turn-helix domain-containing protein [Geovibrio sp.]|nr:helix-turn-helix domain-containing protein [Geovibrio sp.]